MEEVGRILPSIFLSHMRRGDPRLVEILNPLWPRAVGKAIARNCRPVSFVSGTLTLATACSSWAEQLHQMSEEVRAGINSFLGKPVVKKLRVHHAPNLSLEEDNWEMESGNCKPGKPELPGWNLPLNLSKLNPEIARTVERSFIKYFSRPSARDLEN